MAGIKHLYQELEKNPDKVKKALSTRLVITEKLDGTAFAVENQGGELFFYKRDQRNPLDLVDRTTLKLYEKPIQFFLNKKSEVLNNIPDGVRLCFEYFFDNKPVNIEYDHLPKNGLCLTHAKEVTSSGNVKRVIDDITELDHFAQAVDVQSPPVLFRGKPTQDQVKILVHAALSKDHTGIKKVFETFGVHPILHDNPNSSIEGIVIKHSNENINDDLFKITDPGFTEQVKEKKGDNGELFNFIVDDFCDFVLEQDPTVPVQGIRKDQKYIDVISKMFNYFISEYGTSIKGANIPDASFSNKEVFQLNPEFITNEKTRKYIEQDTTFKQVFRIVLNLFRRKKKRRNTLIDQERKGKINLVVDHIWEKMEDETPSVPTFKEFKKQV